MSGLVFIIVSLLTVHVVCDKSIYMFTYMYIRNLNLHIFIKNELNILPVSFYLLVITPPLSL